MHYSFPSRRSVVMGFGGAVATSQPLAAQAGLRMLLAGGNAVDAAIATAAVLNVVEPMSTGIGGDAFALVYWAKEGSVYALNASGRAPAAATVEVLRWRGFGNIPERGALPVTVPGAPAGWADLEARFGRLGLDRVLAPAIDYAEKGFPVSELISRSWRGLEGLLHQDAEAERVFLPRGRAPRPGERFTCPDLARSLRLLAEHGPEVFYRGELAEAIVRTVQEHGGLLSMEDLAAHRSTWEEPISTEYRGYRVYECPPNGQGIAVLIALNILNGYDLAALDFASADAFHLKMEAVKLAMVDAGRYVADPSQVAVPVEGLLSTAYAEERRALIRMDRAISVPQPGLPPSEDTVYLSVIDGEGNAVSFINSLYMGFGSGLVARGTGIVLQNRGNLFTLDPEHPNCLAPRKRPYHTIIPGLATYRGKLALCFGVMGGFMQPQGQVQVLTNLLDHGMNPQVALDAPRFNYQTGSHFLVEKGLPEALYVELERRGHTLSIQEGGNFGGGQIIAVDPSSGALLAGSEPRKDGCAVAF